MIRRDKFVFLLVVMHSYFPESERTVKLFEGFGSRFKKKKIISQMLESSYVPHSEIQRRKWQPIPVFLHGEFHRQRSLVGCCLWGCTGSDMTEATQQQQQHSEILHMRISQLLQAIITYDMGELVLPIMYSDSVERFSTFLLPLLSEHSYPWISLFRITESVWHGCHYSQIWVLYDMTMQSALEQHGFELHKSTNTQHLSQYIHAVAHNLRLVESVDAERQLWRADSVT